MTLRVTARVLGSVSLLRAAAAPLGAGIAMVLVALALSGAPWVPAALLSIAAYAGAFLAIERSFFPGDFAFYSGIMRFRRIR
jgi:hypothetical protein